MFRQSRRIDGAHQAEIWCCDWKENAILTGSLDGTVKLWNANSESDSEEGNSSGSFNLNPLSTTALKRKVGVTSVVASNGGDMAVSCFQDGVIKFNSLSPEANLSELGTIEAGLLEAWTVCISPGDDVIASGTNQGTVNIWSVQDRAKVATLNTGGKFVFNTSFSPSSTNLASSSIDGSLYYFDIATQSLALKVEAHALPVRQIVFSEDGNLIFSASDDRHVSVFDLRSGTVINSFSHSGMALSVDVSSNRRHFVVGCSDHIVSYWDLGMQRCLQSFDTPHKESVWGVKFSLNPKRFCSVADDAILQVYESSG